MSQVPLPIFPPLPSLFFYPRCELYEQGCCAFVAGFVDEHPGGSKILKRVAGKDATKQFWKYHNESVLKKYQERLKVGTVEEKAKL
jgi:hypothetical protein